MEANKKKEDMSHRIKELKDLKHEIEMSLGKELIEIVKCNRGFSFDFSILVGSVINVIEKAKTNPRTLSRWKEIGDQVRQSKSKVLPSDEG